MKQLELGNNSVLLSDIIDFAMLPDLRLLVGTVWLLDVMCPESTCSQWESILQGLKTMWIPACPGLDNIMMLPWRSLSQRLKKTYSAMNSRQVGRQHAWALTHWASENGKLLGQQENLLVPDDWMALFRALTLSRKNFQLYKMKFYCSVLQPSWGVDSDSFFGPREFKKADTRR